MNVYINLLVADGHIWEPFWMNPDAMDGGQ